MNISSVCMKFCVKDAYNIQHYLRWRWGNGLASLKFLPQGNDTNTTHLPMNPLLAHAWSLDTGHLAT